MSSEHVVGNGIRTAGRLSTLPARAFADVRLKAIDLQCFGMLVITESGERVMSTLFDSKKLQSSTIEISGREIWQMMVGREVGRDTFLDGRNRERQLREQSEQIVERLERCGIQGRAARGRLSIVDQQAWLTDTLNRIADHKINRIDELLPWHNAQAWA